MSDKNYDGWVFKWTKGPCSRIDFCCTGTFRLSRFKVIDYVVKIWQKEDESQRNTWRKIRRKGGRVVKVKLVEVI